MERLLLFDIDGTLTEGGPAKEAFAVAIERVYGTLGRIDGHDFSGKTDPQIAREILSEAGLENAQIDERMQDLWREYLPELDRRLPETPMRVLPGVRDLLEHLHAIEGVGMGLLTGNILDGARLKLGSVGLMEYFPVGGFGSDSEVREDLPDIARARAAGNWGVDFPPEVVVVIGDTPRDVACGRHGGTRTVAVATGRFGMDELLAAGPDEILEDWGDMSASVQAILQ